MKQRHSVMIGLLILLLVWPAVGEPESVPWTRTETSHFTIFSQSGYQVGHRVGADLERLDHVLATLTNTSSLESPLPNYFYVFSDEGSLAPFRQPGADRSSPKDPVTGMEVIGGTPDAGYLVPHEHGNYAVVVGNDDFVPTRYVYKQYIHHRLQQEHQYLPHWLRQGVAEFYSTFKTEGDFAVLGLPSQEHVQWIRHRSGGLLPAAELMAIDQADLRQSSPARRETFFRQSWALFHYLLNREQASREQILVFIGNLAAGMPSVQAFEQAYGTDVESLSSELDAYLNKGSLTYLKISVKKLDLLILKSVDLKSHELEYHLGDLSARAVRGGGFRAAEHFQRALELQPDFGPAWAGLGYLAQSAEDHEAALQHYEKAVATDPDDFLTFFLYGKSLLRTLEGRRPADEAQEQVLQKAIESLRKSVELSDGFAEAWADLGYAYGLQTEASDAGVEALQRALKFFPERSDLALNLLLAHARRGERSEAEATIARMKSSGADAATLGRTQEILLQMDYREAVRKVRHDQVDEAIALFARIRSETRDPGLKQTVEQQLEKLSIAGDYEEFFVLYNQAAQAINSQDTAAAEELLDRLEQRAEQSWQLSQVKKLRRILAKNLEPSAM